MLNFRGCKKFGNPPGVFVDPIADGLHDRRLALQSIAGLYRHPEAFGTQGIELLPMKGFKLEDASFEPNALRVPRPGRLIR
eukprot:symbB.v1.2.006001.t1/scaffold338.1/size227548/3